MSATNSSTAAQVLDASAPAPVSPPTQAAASGAASPPGVAPSPSTDEKISPKLQLLIQREKTALERERVAKAKEAELEAKLQAMADREARLNDFESARTSNPKKAMELLGYSYEDLTKIQMADGDLPPDLRVKQVEDKFNSYVQNQEAERTKQEEAQKQQDEKKHTQTIDNFKKEIGSYLKENPHRYELIEFEQAHDLIYDVIDEHYNRTLQAATKTAEEAGESTEDCRGEVMTIAQASDKVELHLEQKYQKAKDLKKVQTFLAPRPGKPNVDKPKLPTSQPPKTLNNQLSATPTPKQNRPLTDDERIARAIAYARGLRPAA